MEVFSSYCLGAFPGVQKCFHDLIWHFLRYGVVCPDKSQVGCGDVESKV